MRLYKKILLGLIGLLVLIFLFFIIMTFFFDNRNINNENELDESKDNVMNNYELVDFIKLTNSFDDKNYQDLLPYSLRMMDTLDIAHYYFFVTYLEIKFKKDNAKSEFDKLEKPERDFLIYILNKGAKAGDDYCREELIDFYTNGIGLPKNIIKADSLTKELGNSKIEL